MTSEAEEQTELVYSTCLYQYLGEKDLLVDLLQNFIRILT